MDELVPLNFDYYDKVVGSDLGIEKYGMIDPQDLLNANFITEAQDKVWVKNYNINKDSMLPCIRNTSGNHKVMVLVGGSPAIQKNWKELKKLDENFILSCCSTSLRFLLDHGLNPEYCVVVDAGDHIVKDFEGCDTKGITLISSPFASPKALAEWKGDIRFYLLGGGKEFNELVRKDWKGQADIDIGGGNVLSTAYLWAYKYLNCRHFIVCGMSLCYYDDYYLEGRGYGDAGEESSKGKFFALDMNYKIANCTPVLWMYKTWLETYVQYAHKHESPGSFINATEDGILGVLPEIVEAEGTKIRVKPTHVPWINVVPLEVAVEGHKLRVREN